MTFEVTNSRYNKARKARIFVDSNLNDIISDWYTGNKVFLLDAKSKAWSSVKRIGTKHVREAIKANMPEVTGLLFSHYAGCSCPCSPGYIADGPTYKNIWVKIQFPVELLDEIKTLINTKHLPLLLEEKEKEVASK